MVNVGTAVAYLNLDATGFNTGLQAANSALQQFQKNGVSISGAFTGLGTTMANIGTGLTKNLTVPIVNFGQSSIQAFRDYESAFAGVKKTIDDDDLTKYGVTYDQLSEAIQKMSTETASSAEEIAAVMEMAGQLGIPLGDAGEDITKFTKTMVMLGDSTNVSAEEAAISLAKFMNITGTAAEDSDKLGASIVDLGNNFATQEDQIINMSTRLASAGTIAGLTEQEILALATSMSSVGIRAEAGGSAMATTLTQIEKIVQGVAENSGQKLQTLGKIAGMTAEDFAKTWKEKPIDALQAFLLGLGDLEEGGESAVVALDDLGMTGVRQTNMLKALALSGENLTDAIYTSNKAWDENTALMEEAGKRYETLDSRISQLKESFRIVQREVAEMLIPVLEKLMDKARELIDWWKSLSDSQKEYAIKIAEVVAAIGPLLIIFGKLFSTIGTVIQTVQLLSSVFGGFSPVIAVVVGVIALLVAGFQKAWNESETFRNTVMELIEQLKRGFELVKTVFMSVWQAIKPVLDVVIEIISNLLQILLPPLVDIITAILNVVQALTPIISALASLIGSILAAALRLIQPLIEGIATAIGVVIEIISALIDIIAIVIETIVSAVKTTIDKITSVVDFVKEMFELVFGFLSDWFKNVINIVHGFVEKIVDFFKWLWDVLFGHSIIPDICNAFIEWFSKTFEKVIEFTINLVNSIIEWLTNLFNSIIEWLTNLFNSVVQWLATIWESIVTWFTTLISSVIQWLAEIWQNIVTWFTNLIASITEWLSNVWQSIVTFFSNLISGITNYLSEVWSNVTGWLANMLSNLSSWFSGLIGRFANWGREVLSSFWNGLKAVWGSIASWFEEKFSWISGLVGKIKSAVSSVLNVGDKINGSHARGLDYVPFDGYVAKLHEGERVLTKQENKDYNNGNGNNSGGDTYNFYNTKDDPYEYARQIKRVKKELEFA